MTDDPRFEAVKLALESANFNPRYVWPEDFCTAIRAFLGEDAATMDAATPIPMILTCLKCGERHIDRGEFALKSHHTHACQSCGLCWRVVPTVGVEFLPGFKDNPDDEEDAERKEVMPHPGSTVSADNATAPATTGADPPWLNEAAIRALLAFGNAQFQLEPDQWRAVARAVLRVANAAKVRAGG